MVTCHFFPSIPQPLPFPFKRQVCRLAELPALETLLLNSNQLGDWPDNLPVPSFSRLTSLALGHNQIEAWSTVRHFGMLGRKLGVRVGDGGVVDGVTLLAAYKLWSAFQLF